MRIVWKVVHQQSADRLEVPEGEHYETPEELRTQVVAQRLLIDRASQSENAEPCRLDGSLDENVAPYLTPGKDAHWKNWAYRSQSMACIVDAEPAQPAARGSRFGARTGSFRAAEVLTAPLPQGWAIETALEGVKSTLTGCLSDGGSVSACLAPGSAALAAIVAARSP